MLIHRHMLACRSISWKWWLYLAVSTHKELDRKWFNSSYTLLFSSTDSLMTGDSEAQLHLPFHTSICHTTLYNHIQLILDYYWILGSQQCAVTAIIFLLLQANGSHRTMSFTNEGVVGCQPLRLQNVFPCARRWELASCPFDSRVRHRWGIYCSHHNIVGVSIHGLSQSSVILSISNKSRL